MGALTKSRLGRMVEVWGGCSADMPTSPNPPQPPQSSLRGHFMKRSVWMLGLAAFAVTPAAAQWAGEPVWNNPKGGTGLTISGDYAKPNADYAPGKGNTWGGRAALGLGTFTITAGVASWEPEGAAKSFTSVR